MCTVARVDVGSLFVLGLMLALIWVFDHFGGSLLIILMRSVDVNMGLC